MSDLCITSIYIEGDKPTLQNLADRINTDGGLQSNIFATLRFSEEDFEYNHCGEVDVLEKEGRYFLQTESWIEEYEDKENWQKAVFPTYVFYELHTVDGVDDWTNDKEGKFFKEHELAIIADGQSEELGSGFDTEAEAIKFVKEHCAGIPKDLMTIEDINTYCMKNHLDTLWYYGHTIVNKTCPPITTKIIECLIEAINKQ